MLVEAIIDSECNYLFTNDREYKENRQEIVQPRGPPENDMNNGPGGPPGQGGQPNQPPQHRPSPNQGGTGSFVTEMRKRIDDYF